MRGIEFTSAVKDLEMDPLFGIKRQMTAQTYFARPVQSYAVPSKQHFIAAVKPDEGAVQAQVKQGVTAVEIHYRGMSSGYVRTPNHYVIVSFAPHGEDRTIGTHPDDALAEAEFQIIQ